MNKVHVKKGDTVIILSGKDKNKKGKVLEVSPTERKVIIEGCNMVTKHVKPRKVMLVCPKCGKGTRLAHKMDGDSKMRMCKHCGETF